MGTSPPRISVIIPTAARRESCKLAARSALGQDPPPHEVMVCDDGSTDGTERDFRAWAQEEPRLKYLRLPENQGSPSPARNLGIENAEGDWIALLDDDDRFLPGKLAVQGELISSGRYDVVASDAKRTSGGPFFGMKALREPPREEFLAHNPIIVSSAVVRRSLLESIGGFQLRAGPFSITGAGDYATWLRLAYIGARFAISEREMIVYDDSGDGRMSGSVVELEAEIAKARWWLWAKRPYDMAVLASGLRGAVDTARWGIRRMRASG